MFLQTAYSPALEVALAIGDGGVASLDTDGLAGTVSAVVSAVVSTTVFATALTTTAATAASLTVAAQATAGFGHSW